MILGLGNAFFLRFKNMNGGGRGTLNTTWRFCGHQYHAASSTQDPVPDIGSP